VTVDVLRIFGGGCDFDVQRKLFLLGFEVCHFGG
jgi:hypothetical protein